MTALGFFRYHLYGDKEDDLQLWPRMTTTFEEADGPDLGIPAEADGNFSSAFCLYVLSFALLICLFFLCRLCHGPTLHNGRCQGQGGRGAGC
ncbi:unnamed protein product, partial [Cuscuta europaea]